MNILEEPTLRCVLCNKEFPFSYNRLYCSNYCAVATHKALNNRLKPTMKWGRYLQNLLYCALKHGQDNLFNLDILDRTVVQDPVNKAFFATSCLNKLDRILGSREQTVDLIMNYRSVYSDYFYG